MFQFSQITDALTGFLGNDNTVDDGAVQEIISQLSNAGIDLSTLEGLQVDQIMEVLSNSGIDLSNFSPDQITDALQHLNIGDFEVSNIVENVDIGEIAEGLFKR